MEHQELRERLLRAKDENTLLSVYPNPHESGSYLVGWVEAMSDEHLLLRIVSPRGFYDGFYACLLDNVFRVDAGTRYAERLRYLYRAHEQRHPNDFAPDLESGANLLLETLLAAQRAGFAIRANVNGSYEGGWVRQVGVEWLTLERIHRDGTSDGEMMVSLDDLYEVWADDGDLQEAKLLSQRGDSRPPDWLNI